MKIGKEKVVSIHYTLKDNEGTTLDSSVGDQPLLYIHGIGNLIPGMEEGLDGKVKGDKVEIKVSPEKGYGVRDDRMIQKMPRSAFGDQKVEVGMQFNAGTKNGQQVVTVTKVEMDGITIDGNHALAGVDLNFSVEVLDVRDASKDELAHGHVHGPGGHHH
ncbi:MULTISPECIES: peptidylprolyl isomerase [unclassified Imperialibacter]|uniref:FKBP-type peptidyl-prolyl cis-trans isomerase n=1 Tax=unclassified Imperialibacter TaxID=2629706 RepID=UPI001251CD2F|nr:MULTISPECIES: peptidylprolyl isomerase [unclassified Imperialibacter]CAD5250490.1 FKBP-type peptidyl-prolyl cis-trans isomerase SlyD [Imperialibacter sp. 75]CAD5286778.1 FKBP-type peptidyl-prolyl cis-trans isomerase SlyD [Imperialibacter sp. 89]VVT05791.1 FKBP-type peptidyl-prolyl cis-trans isomerase SlyD [Imperialibacter sp. EC-SDR9]